jgi:type IV fimbrial biogenesis protein FimT
MNALRSDGRGFTLIELLVTIMLVAMIGMFAAPSFSTFAANQAVSGAASDLLSAALQARGAALKYNQRVEIQPLSGTDWKTGWRIFVDADADGELDSSEVLISEQLALPTSVAIGSHTGTTPNLTKMAFRGDGFLFMGSSPYNNGTIVFKSGLTARERYFIVNRSGRPRVCDPVGTTDCVPN